MKHDGGRNKKGDGLRERVRREVPPAPGVYMFYDRGGGLLYVGKSINLRQRMASYFNGGAKGGGLRTERLICGIRDFAFRETDSELLALIEEDRLIKQHRPPGNVRQKKVGQNRWLVLTGGAYPTFKTVESAEEGGDRRGDRRGDGRGGEPADAAPRRRVFGPFRDRFFAAELLDIAGACFGVRSCRDAEPRMRCLKRDIGLCSGPCRGDVDHGAYAAALKNAAAFLDGRATEVLAMLEAAMQRSAAALDFEKASRFRDRIHLCREFCRRQRFIRRFRTGMLVVQENGAAGSTGLTHLFVRGAHSAHQGILSRGEADAAIRRMLASETIAGDARCVTDRAHIVLSWLGRHKKKAAHYFVRRVVRRSTRAPLSAPPDSCEPAPDRPQRPGRCRRLTDSDIRALPG